MNRRFLAIVLAGAVASLGASYRTPNFVVHAPTQQVAQQIGQWAEHYRKEKALQWLGQEMPAWPQPCPLIVQLAMDGPSGATSFNFGPQGVLSQKMEIKGPLDRLIASVLPHEITHTVFAHYFRMPVPRWADEGGSVLSEDDLERRRHDQLVRNILNNSQQIPMQRLFSLREYPREVMCLYAQGFSVSDYLVGRSDRHTFLQFVGAGMNSGWDSAVQRFYGHRNVQELEAAWLKHLRDTKQRPSIEVAGNTRKPGSDLTVRMTAPPAGELAPVVRGQTPTVEQMGQRFGDVAGTPVSRPATYVPYNPPIGQGWQMVQPMPAPVMVAPAGGVPPPVVLGTPQFDPFPGPTPAGFPH